MMVLSALLVGSLVAVVSAAPQPSVKRQISQLRDSYDFIVAGGGTSGLTVADRLSEAFPARTVLVVEYGVIEYAAGIFDPPDPVWGGASHLASSFGVPTLPNTAVLNKTTVVNAGKVVGGSSCINGMFFDRPSKVDAEAWAAAGSPEFDASPEKWNWNGIYPSFKKSVTFTVPRPDVVAKYNYTWDISVYGGTTPIYSSFPPFLWGDHPVGRGAFKDLGAREAVECAGGDKEGLCWIPISEHPVTARRSHAGLGHYAAVNQTRPNYDLLVQHQVVRVVYPNGPNSGSPLVEVRSLSDNRLFNVTSKAEVIISAGAFHTPTILQRSGIGPAQHLNSAGVPTVVDLPGVGSNLQDHSGSSVSWNYTKPGNFSPAPSEMANPAFAADAAAGFDETPARGPYTLAMANSAIFISLPHITANYSTIVNKIRSMVSDGSGSSYLPAEYSSNPAMVAGYKHQLSILADLFSNPEAPTLETPFATGTAARAIFLHPTSRGTVRLNLTDHLAIPVVDYRTASNPVDFDVHIAHLRYLRRLVSTPTLAQYGAVEVTPGQALQSDAELLQYVKESMVFSFLHPCCTAAMMPKEKGGVVGPDLKVHGAKGLRVVDMSILPLLPSAHLSATAYAVGEKAAEIIIEAWNKVKCKREEA